jgi:putative transposase
MEKFQNTFRVPSARLKNYDYGSHGLYFITICTKNKEHYFGSIVETHNNASPIVNTKPYPETHCYASLRETDIGKIAIECWRKILEFFPFVELDQFVLMPNHIHGIIFINKPDYTEWKENKFGPQSQNLASIIRAFKGAVKRYANKNNIVFEWQERYYDQVITSPKELENIRQYIFDNPKRWLDSRRDA